MSEQRKSDDKVGGTSTRRNLLAGLSLAMTSASAGCGGLVRSLPGAPDRPVGQDETPTGSGTPTEDPTPTPEPGPQLPEATYVVAQDGSGDYDSLSAALQVTQSGDVLRLKAGKYTWSPRVNVSGNSFDSFAQQLTFVGDSPENTTLNIAAENVKNKTISAAENPPKFYNIQLSVAPDVTFGTNFGGDGGKIHYSRVSGSLIGNFESYETRFDGSLSVGGAYLTKCTVGSSFRFGDNFVSEQTTFNSTVVTGQGDDGSGEFIDCVLNAGVVAPKEANRTNPVLRRCEIKPKDDGVALNLKRPLSNTLQDMRVMHPDVRKCDIQGRIKHSGGTWIANRFTTGGASFDYFFDDPNEIGRHPGGFSPDDDGNMVMWGNIFEGADVRFGGSDLVMYNEDLGIGNYYSEWDASSDENDDQISDLPRPIPGSGDVVDQYPLMKANREKYELLSGGD